MPGQFNECNPCNKRHNCMDKRKNCDKNSEKHCEKHNDKHCGRHREKHCERYREDSCDKYCEKSCDKNYNSKCNCNECQKKCDTKCTRKRSCKCSDCRENICRYDDDCDLKIKISKSHECDRYEAMSLVCGDEAILMPLLPPDFSSSEPIAFGILFDFDCKKKLKDLILESNCISYGRITDATDVDKCGNFWFLSVLCPCGENVQFTNSCLSLIKAHYDSCANKVSLLSKFSVLTTCNSCPNFEGLVQVSAEDFFLFSNGCDPKNHSVLFVTIKDGVAMSVPVNIKVNNKKLCDEEYDCLKISTAFNVENGVIFVPQYPEKHCDHVFKISTKEIRRLKKELEPGKKEGGNKKDDKHDKHDKHNKHDHKKHDCKKHDCKKDNCNKKCLTVEACELTLCIRMENACRHDPMICPMDPFEKFSMYLGIESMTSNNCGELFGTSIWVYPPYYTQEEISTTQLPLCDDLSDYVQIVNTIDDIPSGYDQGSVGFYTRTFVGKILCKENNKQETQENKKQ